MSYVMDCACGAEVRLYDKADRNICKTCDVVNRRFVLKLAEMLRDHDTWAADMMVRLSSYETDNATIGVS